MRSSGSGSGKGQRAKGDWNTRPPPCCYPWRVPGESTVRAHGIRQTVHAIHPRQIQTRLRPKKGYSALQVAWWGSIPFVAMLLCIALMPLLPRVRHLWEHVWFQLLVSCLLGIPVGLWVWLGGEPDAVIHSLVEYAQFITLLFSLFVVTGGIHVAGDLRATPRNNTIMLAIGAALASFIGTTGAAMLMSRVILNANIERRHKVHTVVFSIFLIANTGGLLTPLGDPPLFLGFLRGVPFLWTMSLVKEWLFINGMLLITYYSVERREYAKEPTTAIQLDDNAATGLTIHGKGSFLGLAAIVASAALLPSIDLHAIMHGPSSFQSWLPLREAAMLSAAGISLFAGDKKARFESNRFQWRPIAEVASVFFGIFLTMIPALAYLAAKAPSMPFNEVSFFVLTGTLSSVLDNAPTYATFFAMAKQLGGSPSVAGVREIYLVSISLGAVLCGACTYIGNGPNLMLKAIADAEGVQMPSFGGYIAQWVVRYLLVPLALMAMIFVVLDWRVQVLGVVLSLAWAVYHARRGSPPTVSARSDGSAHVA